MNIDYDEPRVSRASASPSLLWEQKQTVRIRLSEYKQSPMNALNRTLKLFKRWVLTPYDDRYFPSMEQWMDENHNYLVIIDTDGSITPTFIEATLFIR